MCKQPASTMSTTSWVVKGWILFRTISISFREEKKENVRFLGSVHVV